MSSEPKAGLPELYLKFSQVVAFSFVAVKLEFEPDGGPKLLKHEEISGMGRDQDELSPGFEHPADLPECEAVIVDVLQVIEADDLVEGALREGQGFLAHLDKIFSEEGLAGFEVCEIQVCADPESSLLAEKITEYALSTAEVEEDIGRRNPDIFPDQVELFFFLEGSLDDLKLPGRAVHRPDYICFSG